MSMQLTIGYRRLPDGSAVPVCEPHNDSFSPFLWQHSALVTLYSPRCVATGTVGGTVSVEGRMEPARLMDFIQAQMESTLNVLSFVSDRIARQYPLEPVVRCVSGPYGSFLCASLDCPFVEIEPPSLVTNGFVHVAKPRISFENGRARLVVTGNDRAFLHWQWADAILRERVEQAVLDHIAKATALDS